MSARVPTRTVHHADALQWLAAGPVLGGCSVVTSLPDVTELPGVGFAGWQQWFKRAAALVLSRTPDDGVAIFYQTDVKRSGGWVDKAYLLERAAEDAQVALLFHQIVCRQPPGTIAQGSAGYSHLLGFSRGLKAIPGRVTDVLPEAGEMTWVRAMGLIACRAACRFVLRETRTRTVVDPFCGVGTVLAVANQLGLDAIGVELNKKRAAKARGLVVTQEE